MRVLRLLLFSAVLIATTNGREYDHVKAMLEWLHSKENGYFIHKLEIRRADPTDPDSYFGVFASENIEKDEKLMHLPRDCLIQVNDTGYHHYDICVLAGVLKKEMELGNESRFAPYVNYLNEQKTGQIPSTWSEQGKTLFLKLIGTDSDGYSDLPPFSAVGLWGTNCDPVLSRQVALIIQRGWDTVLCPIYDMMNHHNGKVNTKNTSVKGGDDIVVLASKSVEAGEELFLSYDMCSDCMGVHLIWGTPEILRDFGFVEQYPQRWHFGREILDQPISFHLDRKMVDDMLPLQVDWILDRKPDPKGMKFLQEQHKRVFDSMAQVIEPARGSVPQHELNIIFQFHKALVTALSEAMATCCMECADDYTIEGIGEGIAN